MVPPKFKAIVIGGGPCGLTLAHSLHLAGLDFVVLEQKDSVFESRGASVVLSAPTLRVMYQFGILQEVLAIGCEIDRSKSFTIDGQELKSSDMFKLMKKNHGCGPMAFHRAQLIEVLYRGLSEEAKANFHFGKKLVDVVSTEHGVEATCADGSIYQGSIVIGADGVHSKTRLMMRNLALKDNPSHSWDSERPYIATYKCMWASFPRPSKEMGQGYDTQHQDRSVMYVTGRELGWIFLYKKLPVSTSDRISYQKEEVEALAEEFKNFPVNETLTVQDVWKTRTAAGMVNLEEGIVDHWSWGRMVLVGDACHKFTPNAGAGLNNGIQDIVTLCNGLREAVLADPLGNPSLETLTGLFADYQAARVDNLQADAALSANLTRMHAWANPLYFFVSKYVTPYAFVERLMVGSFISKAMSQAPVLDYVPGEEPFEGEVAWANPIPRETR
ncbi:hypothetical protein ACJ41O_006827 [Fusarium nematophilum]